jgi:hypothetical protein
MMRHVLFLVIGALAGVLMPAAAGAQPAATAAPAVEEPQVRVDATSPPDVGRLWLVGGAAFATTRGDCQTCEAAEFPYRHSSSIVGNLGWHVNRRADLGAEVFWIPVDTPQGQIKVTHLDAVVQFRPWTSQGFFLKTGAGMALIRNWVDVIGPSAENSKALSVVIGGGWEFRPAPRLGMQFFASQHVSAIGDLTTGDPTVPEVPDVVGNFWSIGVAIVIR